MAIIAPMRSASFTLAAPAPDHALQVEEEEYRQFVCHRALQLIKGDFEETTWKAAWAWS